MKTKRNEQDMQYLENTLVGKNIIGKSNGEITVRPLGHRDAVQTTAELEGVVVSRELTYYDKIIADAIYTLYEMGEDTFTLNRVAEVLTGGKWPLPTIREKIRASIKKMTVTRVTIDCTEEIEKREHKKQPRTVKFEDYLLPIESAYEDFGDHETVVYHLKNCPPLLAYAKRIKQVIAYDPALLQVGKRRNDDSTLMLRYILLSKIMMLANGKGRTTNTVTLEEINKLLGLDPTDRKKRQKVVEAIETILEAYQETNVPLFSWETIEGKRNSWQGVRLGVMPQTIANEMNQPIVTDETIEPVQMKQDKDDEILTFWETDDEMLDWWATKGMEKIARQKTKQMRS